MLNMAILLVSLCHNSYSFSFADISAGAMFQDINILIIGIFMMFIYIQIVVSKFDMVEFRVS